jgi:mitogen-activated protein kinase 15
LKKIYEAFRNSTDAQRAYREVKYLQKLKHPNIISYESFYLSEHSRDLYLMLEYMESDLSSAVRKGVLQEIHKHFIFYQIANGVHFLHSAQLMHRDLKPSNVLIN